MKASAGPSFAGWRLTTERGEGRRGRTPVRGPGGGFDHIFMKREQ
jgi:hypothetical protein